MSTPLNLIDDSGKQTISQRFNQLLWCSSTLWLDIVLAFTLLSSSLYLSDRHYSARDVIDFYLPGASVAMITLHFSLGTGILAGVILREGRTKSWYLWIFMAATILAASEAGLIYEHARVYRSTMTEFYDAVFTLVLFGYAALRCFIRVERSKNG